MKINKGKDMNKLFATTALLATIVSTTTIAAERNTFPYWYLGLTGGAAFQNDADVSTSSSDLEYDAGWVASVSVGYQPANFGGFRVEGEYSHYDQAISNGSGDVKADIGAANVYYDFYNSSVLTPYIGGGIGYGTFEVGDNDVIGDSQNGDRFIYQGLAGVSYEPKNMHNVGVSLGYRYMAPFNDLRFHNADIDYTNHSVEAGLKFRF